MAVNAKFKSREAVMRRLRQLVPDAEKEAAAAQMEAATELASAIAARAPVGATGEYKRSIQGDKLSNRPGEKAVGGRATKDPNATGVFASYKWRWLEFGTKERVVKKTGQKVGKVDAQPHVLPTYRGMKKRIRRKVAGAINKAVRKAKR